MNDLETLIESIGPGSAKPLYLVAGDLVVSEPAAMRLGERLAAISGTEVEVRKRPDDIAGILADLQTFSLFFGGKVIVVVDTALLADRDAAASLIDDAAKALPLTVRDLGDGTELGPGERRAAKRLFQVLRLFQIDPLTGSAEAVLSQLPDWTLAGGAALKRSRSRGRPKKEATTLRADLESLVEVGRRGGIHGASDDALAGMADLHSRGLPDGHFLVLAENSVAKEHPLADAVAKAGAFVQLTQVTSSRQGWQGLKPLVAELERETGVAMELRAMEELAKRTLRQESAFSKQGATAAAASSARFAAEYRRLAGLTLEGSISEAQVRDTTADRGEQDVWSILDSIGRGGAAGATEAVEKLDRYLAAASDRMAARFSFWSLLVALCRHMTAISGAFSAKLVSPGETNYGKFKASIAPRLQAALPSGSAGPLARVNVFRLHRAYLVASRMPASRLATLPAKVIETEKLLKGGSKSPDTALIAFVVELAGSVGSRRR
jgi:DNA polymerase III delta subunit